MTLEELYEQIGGDYKSAIAYLRSPVLVERFIIKFADDAALPTLFSAWAARDRSASFKSAHEAKGLCTNLFLRELASKASRVTEALRPANERPASDDEIDELVQTLHETYDNTIRHIRAYRASR